MSLMGEKRINYAVQLSPKDFPLSFNPGKIYFLFLSIFIIKKDLFWVDICVSIYVCHRCSALGSEKMSDPLKLLSDGKVSWRWWDLNLCPLKSSRYSCFLFPETSFLFPETFISMKENGMLLFRAWHDFIHTIKCKYLFLKYRCVLLMTGI